MNYTGNSLLEPAPTLAEVRAGQLACNRARYLAGLTLAAKAALIGDLIGSLGGPGSAALVPVAVLHLCRAQAVLEAAAALER